MAIDNNSETVTRSAADIVRILILQKRESFIDAVEAYNKLKRNGAKPSLSIMKSRLNSLCLETREMIRRHRRLKDVDILDLEKEIEGEDYYKIMNLFYEVNQILDRKGLINIEREYYDGSIAEEGNKRLGG